MKQFHQAAALPNEDEHVTITHITPHLLMHHPAERADALSHIRPPRAQIVAHCIVKAEHGSQGFCPTDRVAHPPCHCRSGHEDHWGTEEWHLWGQNLKKLDLHAG